MSVRVLVFGVVFLEALTGTVLAADEKPAPAAGDETAKRIAIGTGGGWWRPGALLQGWWVFDHYDEHEAGGRTIDGTNANQFRVRRAELFVKGEAIPGTFGFDVMIDPAKVLETEEKEVEVRDGDGAVIGTTKIKQPAAKLSVFQHMFVTYMTPWADVSIGQFKIPVSYEGYNSSGRLLFPERAPVSKAFGDQRDVGLRVARTFKYAGYSAGMFNGTGLNVQDTNNAKDLALRIEAYPFEGLTLAGVAYYSVGERDEPEGGVRDRFEADLKFERWGFLVQSEYIQSHDTIADPRNPNAFAETDGQGFYVALGYTIRDTVQPVVRFGQLNPDTSKTKWDLDPKKDTPFARHFDAGVNWFIQRHEAKLQLAYSRFDYDNAIPTDNQVIFAAQAGY
ncbi:MAG: hypothetical protein HY897_16300 [Deltaproteobacteria bacterium]|nr:hypothetical protein [Deltaproteobacteria bacterium]